MNLNADLLDGLTTYDSNWTAANGASIVARDPQGATKVKDITATGIFQGGSGAFPVSITGNNATIGGNNEISNLTVTGTTTFNGGTLNLGNAATDNVVFGGEVDSNIIPDDDGSFDLGSSSKEWKDLFIDGTAHIDLSLIHI